MKRIIYSLYIDVPEDEFVDNTETNLNTKKQFKDNYIKLLANKQWYSDQINVDFKLFEYDDYKEYYNYFKNKYPYITTYNIINFYKLHLLCELSKSYDEILYLDFDVVCLTNENFFETWNLNKGICVYNNSSLVKTIEAVTERSQTIRSPTSKYYNAQAMLIEKGLNPKNKVINTGIIGANREHINQLKYFENFDDDLNIMTQLKSNYDIFPKKIIDFFGYDNETLFSVKLNEHKVPVQWLDNHWHYFFDTQGFIPKETKFVHTINKKFDVVWRRYYA
jgi:hypothetical protein